jgi:hypothetical protein
MSPTGHPPPLLPPGPFKALALLLGLSFLTRPRLLPRRADEPRNHLAFCAFHPVCGNAKSGAMLMTTREIFYRNRAHDYLAAAQCARKPGARAALMEVVTTYTMLAELDAHDGAAEQAEEIRSYTSSRPRNRYQAVAAALAH